MREQELLERAQAVRVSFTPYPGYFRTRTREFENLVRFAPEVFREKNRRVAEIGCGLGYNAALLSCRFDSVKAVDIPEQDETTHSPSLAKAQALRERLGVAVEFLAGSLDRLPLKDQSVDVLYHQYVLEHVLEPKAAFAEMRRVQSDGGLMIAIVPNFWDRAAWFGQYYFSLNFPKGLVRQGRIWPAPHDARKTYWQECREYRSSHWESLLASNGYRILKKGQTRWCNRVYVCEKS